jgi:chemotaxis protein methyltransferase CheR
MDLTITPQVFVILNGLIEERLGMHYALADKSLLESKVSTRALELGFDSLLDYYYYLRYDDADGSEFDLLTEALVVNETYFFREYDQLQAVLARYIAPTIERGARPRIWSAACATGEEPASIAMWLEQRGLLDSVELVATDVSQAALNIARKGQYRLRSLRQIPPGVDHPKWIREQGSGLVLDARIRDAIQWRKLNLMEDASVRELPSFDLILCRNLLIYFREDVARRVVERLTDRLTPNGVLLVGVSESLMRFGTRLNCEEHDGVFIYRKATAP